MKVSIPLMITISLLLLLCQNAYGCKPCRPAEELPTFLQTTTSIPVIAKIIQSNAIHGELGNQSGGETIIEIIHVLNSTQLSKQLSLRRFFGMCDFGVPFDIIDNDKHDTYLLFLNEHTYQGKTIYHFNSCAKIYPFTNEKVLLGGGKTMGLDEF